MKNSQPFLAYVIVASVSVKYALGFELTFHWSQGKIVLLQDCHKTPDPKVMQIVLRGSNKILTDKI